eukprot:2459987-Prymnesium_polylepis.1
MATHGRVRAEAEIRRRELVQLQLPRRDRTRERKRRWWRCPDGGEAAGEREERWSAVRSLVFHADPAKRKVQSRRRW